MVHIQIYRNRYIDIAIIFWRLHKGYFCVTTNICSISFYLQKSYQNLRVGRTVPSSQLRKCTGIWVSHDSSQYSYITRTDKAVADKRFRGRSWAATVVAATFCATRHVPPAMLVKWIGITFALRLSVRTLWFSRESRIFSRVVSVSYKSPVCIKFSPRHRVSN